MLHVGWLLPYPWRAATGVPLQGPLVVSGFTFTLREIQAHISPGKQSSRNKPSISGLAVEATAGAAFSGALY
jgi:hypothetical protein